MSINLIHRLGRVRDLTPAFPESAASLRPGFSEATFNGRTLSDRRCFFGASTSTVVLVAVATAGPGGLTLATRGWLVEVSAAGFSADLLHMRSLDLVGLFVPAADATDLFAAFVRTRFALLGVSLLTGVDAAFARLGFLSFTLFVALGGWVAAGLWFLDVVFDFLRFSGACFVVVDALGVATDANATRSSGMNTSRSPSATNSYEDESSGMIRTMSLGHSPSSTSSLCMTIWSDHTLNVTLSAPDSFGSLNAPANTSGRSKGDRASVVTPLRVRSRTR